MTCAEYRNRCDAGFAEHARECAACGRHIDNQNRIGLGLRALAHAETRGPSASVQAALLREYAQARRGKPWKAVAFAGALAAGLACLVVLRPEKQPIRQVETRPLVATAPHTEMAAPTVTPQRHRRRVTHRAPPRPEVVPAEFVVVPFATPLETGERAQLLRVAMPVATLASWGFPIAAGDPDRVIRADVVVGENGLARAVRLIR